MPPEDTTWPLDPHTAAKHAILRNYLDAWIPIMASRNSRIVLVDGFAGPGVYDDGEPGSPIIMLNAFLEHSARARIEEGTELVYLFIENRSDRVARLQEEIARLGELPKNVRIELREGDYEDVFSSVLDGLGDAKLAPTFAFIDPFGYSDASMSLHGRFLQFSRCEALVYFPLPFVNRFAGRAGQEAAMTSLYGGESWREAFELVGPARAQRLLDLFQTSLEEAGGLKYVRSFEIVSSSGNYSGYHMFFGTNHPLGLERMKEAMWDVDPVQGQRFRDSTLNDSNVLFEPEPDLTPLREALVNHFRTTPFDIQEALDYALIETPFLPSHVKKRILKPMEMEHGTLECVDPAPNRRRGTYPEGTKLRFTR